MSKKVGKISPEDFQKFVAGRLGRPDPRIIVPPTPGVDAGVIRISGNKVLVVAEDPIFPAPGLPLETFGWFTVHIGASDVAVMGVKPEFLTYTLLMPPGTGGQDLAVMVDSIHRAALELDIAIAGGHTGYYPAVTIPTIGGVTVFAFADEEDIITPRGARAGDVIILTKGPAVEAAGLLAIIYENRLRERYPSDLVDRALSLHRQITCVKDALVAARYGATAMHDATEGGVIGGLFEVAEASGVGMRVDESRFVFPEEIRMVCEFLEIDPVEAIAEGTLVLTAPPDRADELLKALREEGIAASVVGEVLADPRVRELRRTGGRVVDLHMPHQDPFWPAFFAGLEA